MKLFFLILIYIKLIFTTKVLHLVSFWKREFLELGSGLLEQKEFQKSIVVTSVEISNKSLLLTLSPTFSGVWLDVHH